MFRFLSPATVAVTFAYTACRPTDYPPYEPEPKAMTYDQAESVGFIPGVDFPADADPDAPFVQDEPEREPVESTWVKRSRTNTLPTHDSHTGAFAYRAKP